MENMSKQYLHRTQLVCTNVKPMEHFLIRLSDKDQVELKNWIKPCSVTLKVLQGKQNFKVRCLIHNRYECRCVNRNKRHVKCFFCSECSLQNKLIKDRKKNYRCPTKQSETSQEKQKKQMKSLNCVNKQFSKEYSELARCNWLFEEDESSKRSSETLFPDHKDMDYHLVNNVKIEQDVECSSRENKIGVQNLKAPVFNISGICTTSDRPGLGTNHIFVHPKIKKEFVNNEEVSIINESLIAVEVHSVSKTEELPEIGENNMPVLDISYSDNKEIETKNVFMLHKPLKATETVQREMETNLQLQNEVQTLNWSLQPDLKIKLETNSRVCDVIVGEEEYVNELCAADGKPFGCNICGKSFTRKANLTVHKRIHSGEKPFDCTVCGKEFIKMDYLTAHKRVHTGEKPFGCTVCGKRFTQLANLTVHKRIHTGEKAFGCTVCGKGFTQLASLAAHKRIHTGEKPFGCTTCGKGFTQLASLAAHKRLHTGENPFGCTTCGKVFTELASLTKHKCVHTGRRL